MMRTRSPTPHSLVSSCTLKRVVWRTTFLYKGCGLRSCTTTITVFSLLSLTTTPSRTLRRGRGVAVASLIDCLLVISSRGVLRGGLRGRDLGHRRGDDRRNLQTRSSLLLGPRSSRRPRRGSCRRLHQLGAKATLDLDPHGHRPRDLVADLANLTMVLDLSGRLLKANFEEASTLLEEVIVELRHGHPAQLIERIGLLCHTAASTSAPVSSRCRNRVLIGSLKAARRIASCAVSRVTPAISKSTRPGSTTATHPSG